MKRLFYLLLLLVSSSIAMPRDLASILFENRDYGLHHSISSDIPIYKASELNFDNLGKTDNSAIFNDFIDSVDSPAMLLFETGTYLFRAPVRLKSNIIISGYDSQQSTLLFDFSGTAKSCININGTAESNFTSLSEPPKRNTKYLISKDIPDLQSMDFIELRQQNGAWDTNPADWAKHSVGQYLTIDHCSEDTIFTKEKILLDYDSGLNPEYRRVFPIQNVVIQYLKLERIDNPEVASAYNINLSKAYNCAIRGVESAKSVCSHVMITGSKNIEVTGSYFHDAFAYDGSGTRGYGVTLNDHTSDCKVENNIFRHLRHAMVCKHGANGNAIAYNYALETNRSEPISDFSGDIQLHGHYSYANLIESNIVQNIWIDEYWGPSGPYNTFLRNRTELYGFFNTSSDTDSLLIIANEISGKSFTQGLFNIQGEGHLITYNNIKGNLDNDDFSADSLPISLIYNTTPAFWDIPDDFPSIGYPNSINDFTIPAKNRYISLEKKTVGAYIPTGITGEATANTFDLQTALRTNPNKRIALYNYAGELIYTGLCKDLNLSDLNSFLFFIEIEGKFCKGYNYLAK